jgi:hypothetical protein
MQNFAPTIIDSYNKLEQQARFFHFNNPHVFDLAETLMTQALERNARYSMRTVWHRMRWHYSIDTQEQTLSPDTGEPLKLNNNHTPYYARWLIQKHPLWQGRIRTRVVAGS